MLKLLNQKLTSGSVSNNNLIHRIIDRSVSIYITIMIIIGSISTNFLSAFNLLYICLSDILKQQMKSRAIYHKVVNSVGFTAK